MRSIHRTLPNNRSRPQPGFPEGILASPFEDRFAELKVCRARPGYRLSTRHRRSRDAIVPAGETALAAPVSSWYVHPVYRLPPAIADRLAAARQTRRTAERADPATTWRGIGCAGRV